VKSHGHGSGVSIPAASNLRNRRGRPIVAALHIHQGPARHSQMAALAPEASFCSVRQDEPTPKSRIPPSPGGWGGHVRPHTIPKPIYAPGCVQTRAPKAARSCLHQAIIPVHGQPASKVGLFAFDQGRSPSIISSVSKGRLKRVGHVGSSSLFDAPT